jgi:hypothetical protein
LIICGHSLGAGVSTILTILLHNGKPKFSTSDINKLANPKWPIECFAYAPPPVLDETTAIKYQYLIHSFVFRDDIVSRLSYGSLRDLLHTVRNTLSQTDNKFTR